jgi:hypothetical protein
LIHDIFWEQRSTLHSVLTQFEAVQFVQPILQISNSLSVGHVDSSNEYIVVAVRPNHNRKAAAQKDTYHVVNR